MIAAHRLTRMFGRFTAVDALDFEIPKGKVVGFLGPNGAGKTTTIRMIAGFLPPSSGDAIVDGVPVWSDRRSVHGRIGYLPEAAPLYTEMRVQEYLKFRCRIFGLPRSQHRAAVALALRRCWLEEVRRRPIHTLSKGFRQRVGLAAALLHEPPVLILDEPTVGLDPSQIREVRNLIRELAGKHTILISTHILPEVEQTCDRILMIARGRVRLEGTIDELRATAGRTRHYTVETTLDDAPGRLRDVGGVDEVRAKDVGSGWKRVNVKAKKDAADLREQIAGAIAQAGGAVRELHREATSLEQLFVSVVGEAEAEDGRPAPGVSP